GPFDNPDNQGLETVYPPEKEIDLKKTHPGKDGTLVGWKEFPDFKVAQVNNLKRFADNDHCCVYLYHEIEVKEAVTLPVSLGSDDGLAVWLNGTNLVSNNAVRSVAPDQDHATLKLKAGKNQLLVKVSNVAGEWAFFIRPGFPPDRETAFAKRF